MSTSSRYTKKIQPRRVHIKLSLIKKNSPERNCDLPRPFESITERNCSNSKNWEKSSNPFKVITNTAKPRYSSPEFYRQSEDRCRPIECLQKKSLQINFEINETNKGRASPLKLSHCRCNSETALEKENKRLYRKNLQRLSQNYRINKDSLPGHFSKLLTRNISNLVVRTDHRCVA
ncbi:unnamed protein product [Blepharisma stoltei]|uniref:Uncharacterized protein n=1 Tax=Blepharisma stoltei TaxID=1481888 RepID=A0AAU9JI01_9CILI|nr:unnamed protein product [Blepharisma stoltei]